MGEDQEETRKSRKTIRKEGDQGEEQTLEMTVTVAVSDHSGIRGDERG